MEHEASGLPYQSHRISHICCSGGKGQLSECTAAKQQATGPPEVATCCLQHMYPRGHPVDGCKQMYSPQRAGSWTPLQTAGYTWLD